MSSSDTSGGGDLESAAAHESELTFVPVVPSLDPIPAIGVDP